MAYYPYHQQDRQSAGRSSTSGRTSRYTEHSPSENDTYYHHTDKHSALKILKSGYIKQSEGDGRNDDAAFGSGTYLTKVGPDASPRQVAQNNYDGMTKHLWESKINDGKTDVAIAVRVPKAMVQECSAGNRDVHVYKGDLKLSDAKDVDVFVRGQDGLKKYSQAF